MQPAESRRLLDAAAELPPGYFALVMATGIISIDARRLGLGALSWALFAVGALAYAVLSTLTAVRLARFRARLARDLHDPGIAFAFFTFVAGTDVLTARLAAADDLGLVIALGCIALAAFALLVRPIARMALSLPFRDRIRVARGNWLVAVVAVESLSIVASVLAGRWRPFLDAALVAWVAGLVLYALLIGFVAARLRRALADPAVFTPDFWITMGALAISTLAGTTLLDVAARLDLLTGLHGAIKGVLWGVWAVATSWIPVVLSLEWWKWRRLPGSLRYVYIRWSTVFPLGMYAAATLGMHDELALPAFGYLGRIFFWTALCVWALAALGLARSLRRTPAPH